MKCIPLILMLAVTLSAAPPAIDELRPRGAQKGRPFTLTIVGAGLDQGPAVVSALPATFTALAPEKPGMGERSTQRSLWSRPLSGP